MSIYADMVWLYIDKISNFGSFPPYARIAAVSDPPISGILFNPKDPLVTAARLVEARAKPGFLTPHLGAGIMYDPSWDGYPDPSVTAILLDQHIARLNPDYVLIDGETHNAQWIRRFLWGYIDVGTGSARKGYRGIGGREDNAGGLRPGKATDWTLESNQDGNWGQLPPGDTIYTDLTLARMAAVLQPYGGSMEPFSEETTLKYVAALGFPVGWLHLCHDPAHGLPSRIRSGVIFSADRWPAMYGVAGRLLRKPQRAHREMMRDKEQLLAGKTRIKPGVVV